MLVCAHFCMVTLCDVVWMCLIMMARVACEDGYVGMMSATYGL